MGVHVLLRAREHAPMLLDTTYIGMLGSDASPLRRAEGCVV